MALLSAGLLLATALQATSATPINTDPDRPATVRAARISTPIAVDGSLTEGAWRGTPVTGFLQRDPDEGKAATERTEVFITYDDEAIYVGARLFDSSPDSIIARLARRDTYTPADRFMVFLDPYHDGRSGFYFGVNAAGTRYDGTLLNDDWDDDSWDGVWQAAAQRDSAGWSVEMRIPYSQLRFQRADIQTWGVNFSRDIARRNERDYLVYTPRNGSGFVSRFVNLSGLDNIRPPTRFEVTPYVTSRAEFTDHAAGDPFNDGSTFGSNVGADLKIGLGSNLTLDGTINPDFGQVEVDPAVVNLSDFETFFPEKRPFFIEGSNIFDFGSGGANNNWGFNWGNPDFFYSRRVGRPPQGGVPDADYVNSPTGSSIISALKLSGKVGSNWSVGTMHALTAREMADVDLAGVRSKVEVEPRTYYSVSRAQKELNGGAQGIGFIGTAAVRDFDDPRLRDEINSTAFTGGIDGWTFLDSDRKWVVTGWFGASRVAGTADRITDIQRTSLHYFQRPDVDYVSVDSAATSLAGYGGRVALNKQKGNWTFNSAVGVMSPGLDMNDLGFQFRSDIINTHVVGGYSWTKPGRIIRNARLNTALFRSWNYGGDVTWTGVWANSNVNFTNYWWAGGFFAYNPRTVDTRLTRGGPATIGQSGFETGAWVGTDDRKPVVLSLEGHLSQYEKDADRSWSVYPGIEYKPSSSMSLRVSPSFERSYTSAQYVGTFEDPHASATFGNRYVFANLQQTSLSASIRLNWIFTPTMSLELYAQPLIASGNYTGFKELERSRSYDFRTYGEDGSTFDDATLTADPDGTGPAAPIQIDNPDFNFRSLRGNAVLRWEYMPGSTLFLVWTQSRSDFEDIGSFRFGHSVGRLLDARADNIFAVKLTYWWNPL